MKLRYTKEFIRKSNIPQYPLIGFYASLSPAIITFSYDDASELGDVVDFHQYFQSLVSDPFPVNTFLKNGKCRISFDLSTYTGLDFNILYLFALDAHRYQSLSQFNSAYSTELYSQLAIVITGFDSNTVINLDSIHILEFNYNPKCSFNCTYELNQVQVDHYNSNNVGSMYPSLIKNDQSAYDPNRVFIDKTAGIDYLKSKMVNKDLDGAMTIRKSGLIQL